MHTTAQVDDFADITINHNSDWSGVAYVRAVFDGARCDFDVPGRELVSGKLTTIPLVPIAVVTRAVALAVSTAMARAVMARMEQSIDDVLTSVIGEER